MNETELTLIAVVSVIAFTLGVVTSSFIIPERNEVLQTQNIHYENYLLCRQNAELTEIVNTQSEILNRITGKNFIKLDILPY